MQPSLGPVLFVAATLAWAALTGAEESRETRGEILWSFDAKGCIYSSPAVSGELVFLAPCRGVLFALDKQTGAVRWSHDAREGGGALGFHADPLFADDMVVIGSDTDDETVSAHVLALEHATGKVRWKHPLKRGVASDIVRDGDRLFMTTRENELICLELSTGRRLWGFVSKPAAETTYTTSAAPVLGRDRVFFAGGNGRVHALDRVSGTAIWQHDVGNPVVGSLSLLHEGLYMATLDGHVYRLDPQSGSRLAELSADGFVATPLAFTSDQLFLISATTETQGELLAVDLALKEVRWRRQPKGARWTSARPYLRGEDLLVGSGTGQLVALSAADGSERWSDTFGSAVRGIGWEGDILYVGTMDGTLYAYRPRSKADTPLPRP